MIDLNVHSKPKISEQSCFELKGRLGCQDKFFLQNVTQASLRLCFKLAITALASASSYEVKR